MIEKIGIAGGLGWRATAYYYAALFEIAGEAWRRGAQPPLEVAVESLEIEVAGDLLREGECHGRWTGFDNYHRAALERLRRSGAGVILIACSRAHERLPEIAGPAGVKPVDLFEAVCIEAAASGARRMVMLGTETTARSNRLGAMLAAHGIEAITPQPDFANEVRRLVAGLRRGTAADAGSRLTAIARSIGGSTDDDMLVGLHCTELPLALAPRDWRPIVAVDGVRFLNAAAVHARAGLVAAGLMLAGRATEEHRGSALAERARRKG